MAARRLHAQQCKGQAVTVVHQPDVARVGEGEGLQRARAGDHGRTRQVHHGFSLCQRQPLHATWRAGEFGAQIGPRRRRWRHAKHDGRSGHAGRAARRRARGARQHIGHIQRVGKRLAREAVAGHGGDAAEQEGRVAALRRAHPVQRGQAGQPELHQRLCFGGGKQRRQGPRQALVHRLVEGRAVQLQLRRPTPGQPLRLRGEKAVVDGGARDAAVGQRLAVRQQIGTLRKGIQHQPRLLLHRRGVGVGAQPAQRLVQVQHRRRPCQPRARELPHQREFAHGQAGPVLARQALQGRQGTG